MRERVEINQLFDGELNFFNPNSTEFRRASFLKFAFERATSTSGRPVKRAETNQDIQDLLYQSSSIDDFWGVAYMAFKVGGGKWVKVSPAYAGASSRLEWDFRFGEWDVFIQGHIAIAQELSIKVCIDQQGAFFHSHNISHPKRELIVRGLYCLGVNLDQLCEGLDIYLSFTEKEHWHFMREQLWQIWKRSFLPAG